MLLVSLEFYIWNLFKAYFICYQRGSSPQSGIEVIEQEELKKEKEMLPYKKQELLRI